MPEVNNKTNDKDYILKLFDYQNFRLQNMENKIDSLSKKFFFYIGFASGIASLISFLLNKLL